jgi:hypothetical protein
MFQPKAIRQQMHKRNAQKIYALIYLSGIMLTSCAHIELQPKDQELVKLQDFARSVAKHIYDNDPHTYMNSQDALRKEVTPQILRQLQDRSLSPKSGPEAKQKLELMRESDGEGGVKIEWADFAGKATSSGLVPVEVKGVRGNATHAEKFDIVLYVGYKPKLPGAKSQEPLIGEIEFKK